MRVIIDNDFAGDPDDWFQLVHHVLSPSVDVRMVIGSHLPEGDWLDSSSQQAQHAAELVTEALRRVGRTDIPVLAGSETSIALDGGAQGALAAAAIVTEAMSDDPRPLFYCAGGGLTDLAAALALEPAIASKMTLVWIGGEDHPGTSTTDQDFAQGEFNFGIDPEAARNVLANDDLVLWQVPRSTYLQATASYAELDDRLGAGELADWLRGRLRDVASRLDPYQGMGEVYVLGDNPLVLLTALQSSFDRETSSSHFVTIPRPLVGGNGSYLPGRGRSSIRVYTRLDIRLLFEDLFAKIRRFDEIAKSPA